MSHPRGGAHYPRSVGEFQAWFQADADCLDYLQWLRWPDGFVCPACGARTSVTAGTIFDRTRTPLTVWFTACWMFASGKDGMSALSLQRGLEIGSYQTAWAMLHRLRSVLVRPGRERLTGRVEVDETFIGGEEPGLRGGRARGATVVTDAWQGYRGLDKLGYVHDRRSQRAARARGEDPGALLPAVHRVASLVKRWLLGTHQGSVEAAHLPSYLNEFVFRFNRRRSRSRGLVFCRVLELAVGHQPVRYHD